MDVFVFPDYRPSNPYQTLFYDDLSCHVSLWYRPVEDALLVQAVAAGDRRSVFHLHWEDAVYRQADCKAGAWESVRDFVRKIHAFKARGGHFVWTIHNETPHDDLHLDAHAWLVRELSGRADAIHVHSDAAVRHLIATRSLDPDKVIVSPHGNYLGYYECWSGTQSAARLRHQLPAGRRTLLMFGRLGSYKGAQELLESLRAPDLAELCLVVAGKQVDPIDMGSAGKPERVVVLDRFIDDEDVPSLFAAADAVVAPYRHTLTSGTVVLSLSMGRPVIAPRLFHIAETIEDGQTGFLYDAEDPAGLPSQLRRLAAAASLDQMHRNALDAGARLSWRATTEAILGVYRKLESASAGANGTMRPSDGVAWIRGRPPSGPKPDGDCSDPA